MRGTEKKAASPPSKNTFSRSELFGSCAGMTVTQKTAGRRSDASLCRSDRECQKKESFGNFESFPHSGRLHIGRVAMPNESTEMRKPSFKSSKIAVDFQGRFVVPHACSRGTKNRPGEAGPSRSQTITRTRRMRKLPPITGRSGAAKEIPEELSSIGLHLTAMRRRVCLSRSRTAHHRLVSGTSL